MPDSIVFQARIIEKHFDRNGYPSEDINFHRNLIRIYENRLDRKGRLKTCKSTIGVYKPEHQNQSSNDALPSRSNYKEKYRYNRQGQLTRKTEKPSRFKVKYRYDREGNIRKTKDGMGWLLFSGDKETFQYNSKNQLSSVKDNRDLADIGTVNLSEYTLRYHQNAALESMSKSYKDTAFTSSIYRFKFKESGQIWSYTIELKDGPVFKKFEFRYSMGNLVGVMETDYENGTLRRIGFRTFQYNEQGWINKVETATAIREIEYQYWEGGTEQ